ncbi:hypothetical protein A165_02500 [Vibrio tasmaniensis ZS-17]|uniref:hypothetical protein n=1 Tax=Vibrio TaxID=662 RepID=UPI0002D79504|nr:hypothetical protein [Vibrio tasmaniensis]OED68891.1 hypothetical protein A165_02500 [Vibrio tasmaniensis ZS-17]
MRKTNASQFEYSIPDLALMLGFERRTVETRLFTNKVLPSSEDNGVRRYILRDAAEAVYRTQFLNRGAVCPSKSIS